MKKIVVLVLALLMCLSLVACSNKNDKKSNKYEKYKKYSDIFELLEDGDYDGAINKIQDLENQKINDQLGGSYLYLNQLVETSTCEFTINSVNITKRVDGNSSYYYYEADSGKVYVDLVLTFKNTDTEQVYVDNVIAGKLIYDRKYNYSGFTVVETDSDLSSYSPITPLSTERVHYLFEVPEEVSNSSKPIEFKLTIGEATYKYTMSR